MNDRTQSNPAALPTGPYTYRRGRDGCDETFDVLDAQGRLLVGVPYWEEAERSEAVARLFAAAPSMLGALERFESALRRSASGLRNVLGPDEFSELLLAYIEARAAVAEAKED